MRNFDEHVPPDWLQLVGALLFITVPPLVAMATALGWIRW